MIRRTLLHLTLLAALATGAAGQESPDRDTIWLAGTSNVKDWSCRATTPRVTVRPVRAARASPPVRERPGTRLDLVVPVEDIGCDHGTMTRHMRETLQEERHPEIRLELEAPHPALAPGETVAVEAHGELTIAGTPRALELRVTLTRSQDGGLRAVGSHQIAMTDFDLDPPRFFFGAIRVRDEVSIRFDVGLPEPDATMSSGY